MTQNYYNPMTSFYRNQMNNISGGYNYTPQYQNTSQMTSQTPINQFPCRSVSNIKEVEALILDNPTVPYIFTNFPNNEIYVKYIDNTTGSAKVINFVPKVEEKIEPVTANDDKVNSRIDVLEKITQKLNEEIEKLKKGLVQNDEFVSDVKSVSKPNGRNGKNVSE